MILYGSLISKNIRESFLWAISRMQDIGIGTFSDIGFGQLSDMHLGLIIYTS